VSANRRGNGAAAQLEPAPVELGPGQSRLTSYLAPSPQQLAYTLELDGITRCHSSSTLMAVLLGVRSRMRSACWCVTLATCGSSMSSRATWSSTQHYWMASQEQARQGQKHQHQRQKHWRQRQQHRRRWNQSKRC
jgi:hypothetical protein